MGSFPKRPASTSRSGFPDYEMEPGKKAIFSSRREELDFRVRNCERWRE
jgi:hypothetical protein